MENLSIKKTKAKKTDSLIRIGDLVNFEGPLIALFEDTNNGHLFLFDWVDRDSNFNRWLVYRVLPQTLLEFLNRKISHLELFESNPDGNFYSVDLKANQFISNCTLNQLDQVPSNYLPEKDQYFDQEDCPSLNKIHSLVIKLLSRKKQSNEYLFTKTFAFQDQYLPFKEKQNRILIISKARLKRTQTKYNLDNLLTFNTININTTTTIFGLRVQKRKNTYA